MQTKIQKNNFKPAVVDQILLWLVIFVAFITLLFMTIDYSAVMRLKGNTDTLAQIGARMIALGRTTDEVATSLNNIKSKYYANISGGDIVCNEVVATTYQVVFNITSKYTNAKVLTVANDIESKVASFNESNANEITCTLVLTNN